MTNTEKQAIEHRFKEELGTLLQKYNMPSHLRMAIARDAWLAMGLAFNPPPAKKGDHDASE